MRRPAFFLLLPLGGAGRIVSAPRPGVRARARPSARAADTASAAHATEWLALTGKPLAATAGAMMFKQGGNAIDAACAMLAATSTMWDVLSWGGETQALIYNTHTKQVVGINALGVAPTGATPDFYHAQGYNYPPEVPIRGLLSKAYAKPELHQPLPALSGRLAAPGQARAQGRRDRAARLAGRVLRRPTSIQAADKEGWVIGW